MAVCTFLLGGVSVPDAAAGPVSPPVIAIVGEGGLNVLHDDFRLAPGARPAFPPGMPVPVAVRLPTSGDWAARLEAARSGPLGNLRPGVLHWIVGTRLLVVAPGSGQASVLGDGNTVSVNPSEPAESSDQLAHGTGVVGAAISRRTGTAPTAWGLFVAGSGAASWTYVADNPWIDVATVSHFDLDASCEAVPAVRQIAGTGRLPFTAAGNTQDTPATVALMPSGLPEMFHVGGVDESGRTRVVPQPGRPTLFHAVQGPQRPYEAGELFTFDGPDSASTSGSTTFGGTSGASPRMAGRAATLIHTARQVLGARGAPGRYARAADGRRRPSTGPLSDGDLTADELGALLRGTAVPAEPASPVRYDVEGYGAVTDGSLALATSVLRGTRSTTARPDDDAAHARTEGLRAAVAKRCG